MAKLKKPTGPSGPTAATGPTGRTGPSGPVGTTGVTIPGKVTPGYVIGSYGNNSIDAWDFAFIAASDAVQRKRKVRVDPRFLKGMMDVESGGNGAYAASNCRPCDGTDCVPACGPMQIKHAYHKHRCPECDFKTVPGQIELAAHIIGMTMLENGVDEYAALVITYFPQGDINGTTQSAYVKRVRKLVGIMEADAGDTKPPPPPAKVITEKDVLNLISSNAPGVYVSFGYGQLNTGGGNFYRYGVGHMSAPVQNANIHTGIDIWMPDETAVNAVFGGEVICVGTKGTPMWGQGCGAFVDDQHGVGNITILTDTYATIKGKQYRLKMTYGHMSSATVQVGSKVAAGQRIGRSGVGNAWPHVHLDVTINAPELNNPQIWLNGGEYHLVDPIPTIINAMGGKVPTSYAERVPIPQPTEFDGVYVTVTVEKDNLPVLQRADLSAPPVREPLMKGDTFEAVYQVVANDKTIWWISTLGSRIPVAGTSAPDWKG